jgi:hypothetical protein
MKKKDDGERPGRVIVGRVQCGEEELVIEVKCRVERAPTRRRLRLVRSIDAGAPKPDESA